MFKKKNKVNIIPLGQNCQPRTILTRWKIKPKKLQGELTYPFDLAVFGVKEVTKSLRTDFAELFDDLEYNGNYWIKAPNCIEFSHEKNIGKNDKEKLINLYKKRIENFRKVTTDETPVLFIQILGEDEDINNLYAQLLKIRGKNPFKLIIVDTHNIVFDTKYDDVYLIKSAFPSEEYKKNWWKKEYYNSPKGKIFEKTITDECKTIIEELTK